MAKIIESLGGNTDNLKEQGYKAVDSAERSAKSAIDNMEWKAKGGIDSVADTYDRVSTRASAMKDQFMEKTQDLRNAASESKAEVERRIKARPITSSLIAFGIGMIAQRLLLGSRKSK